MADRVGKNYEAERKERGVPSYTGVSHEREEVVGFGLAGSNDTLRR